MKTEEAPKKTDTPDPAKQFLAGVFVFQLCVAAAVTLWAFVELRGLWHVSRLWSKQRAAERELKAAAEKAEAPPTPTPIHVVRFDPATTPAQA